MLAGVERKRTFPRRLFLSFLPSSSRFAVGRAVWKIVLETVWTLPCKFSLSSPSPRCLLLLARYKDVSEQSLLFLLLLLSSIAHLSPFFQSRRPLPRMTTTVMMLRLLKRRRRRSDVTTSSSSFPTYFFVSPSPSLAGGRRNVFAFVRPSTPPQKWGFVVVRGVRWMHAIPRR